MDKVTMYVDSAKVRREGEEIVLTVTDAHLEVNVFMRESAADKLSDKIISTLATVDRSSRKS